MNPIALLEWTADLIIKKRKNNKMIECRRVLSRGGTVEMMVGCGSVIGNGPPLVIEWVGMYWEGLSHEFSREREWVNLGVGERKRKSSSSSCCRLSEFCRRWPALQNLGRRRLPKMASDRGGQCLGERGEVELRGSRDSYRSLVFFFFLGHWFGSLVEDMGLGRLNRFWTKDVKQKFLGLLCKSKL